MLRLNDMTVLYRLGSIVSHNKIRGKFFSRGELN